MLISPFADLLAKSSQLAEEKSSNKLSPKNSSKSDTTLSDQKSKSKEK